jgi:hypothetical protein
VSTADLTAAELDHGHPCGTCRWYVIWIRRAEAGIASAITFAHAHHHITRAADQAIGRRDRLRDDYRAHYRGHTSERGDS